MVGLKAGLVVALLAITTPAAASQVFASLDRHGKLQVSDAPRAGATAFDPHRPFVPAGPKPAARAAAVKTVAPSAMPKGASRWNPLI